MTNTVNTDGTLPWAKNVPAMLVVSVSRADQFSASEKGRTVPMQADAEKQRLLPAEPRNQPQAGVSRRILACTPAVQAGK